MGNLRPPLPLHQGAVPRVTVSEAQDTLGRPDGRGEGTYPSVPQPLWGLGLELSEQQSKDATTVVRYLPSVEPTAQAQKE
eukprot:scaffold3020_cov342-Prasinococcus_capsulatus_cf.AAC.4